MLHTTPPPSFFWTIVLLLLFILPMIHCTNLPLKSTSTEKPEHTSSMASRLVNALHQQEKSKNDHAEAEYLKTLIDEFIKSYPHRRASSFHAMRGKRSIDTV